MATSSKSARKSDEERAQELEAKAREADVERALAEANTQTSNHPDPEGTETVRVLAGHVLYVSGNAYVPTQVLDLPKAAAQAEAEAGRVEIVGPPERLKH